MLLQKTTMLRGFGITDKGPQTWPHQLTEPNLSFTYLDSLYRVSKYKYPDILALKASIVIRGMAETFAAVSSVCATIYVSAVDTKSLEECACEKES